MKITSLIAFLFCFATASLAEDEFNVTLNPEARLLSKELQANAHSSPVRFDDAHDVSKLKAWMLGSVYTSTEDFHLIAYFYTPQIAYLGVFRRDKKLSALWKFSCDARQLYVEGSKLMFSARPMIHKDTEDSFGKVPREAVIDFSALVSSRSFRFHDSNYTLTE